MENKNSNRKAMFDKVRACLDSGQTKRNWCAQNNIRENVFYYWLQQYRKAENHHTSGFVLLKPKQAHQSGGLKISYPNGVKLELESASDFSLIQTLIRLY
jgi:transposase-like protein